jgi:hypothetical protein
VKAPSPPRGLRLARLPLLLAYLLVLLGTPVGEAGFRWVHLTTAHSSPAIPGVEVEWVALRFDVDRTLASTPEHEPDTPPAHEHEHAAAHTHPHEHSSADEHEHTDPPEHDALIASARDEAESRSVAPDQPHEHGGRVHTHQQQPAPDAALLIDALSKFYLAPPTASAPSLTADARRASRILPAPLQVAARIDTPPPRLLA